MAVADVRTSSDRAILTGIRIITAASGGQTAVRLPVQIGILILETAYTPLRHLRVASHVVLRKAAPEEYPYAHPKHAETD